MQKIFDEIINKVFDLYGDRIVVIHAKDFVIEEGKVKSKNLEIQIASDNNKRSFIEIFDEDNILKEALNGDLNKWKYFHLL